MVKILDVLNDVCDAVQVLPCARVNVDYGHFEEYTATTQKSPPQEVAFEHPRPKQNFVSIPRPRARVPSLMGFFLDGSRRTHRVADLVVNGRYYPVVAGQIGVAVLERQDGKLSPRRDLCAFRNVIALPDRLGDDSAREFEDELNSRSSIRFSAVTYDYKADADPVDLAVARIMSEMQQAELGTAESLAKRGLIGPERMLLRDGPLQFADIGKVAPEVFRGVIGVSKTFRPSFQVGKGRGRKHVGCLAAGLDMYQRSQAYKYDWHGRSIGTWYLRIRNPRYSENPLDGVLKIERVACDDREQSEGLDAELLNTLSLHVMEERNVTPYGTDSRWPSHLYPIYLAERFIRASFKSDMSFIGMFGSSNHGL